MKIKTEPYLFSKEQIPRSGQHIVAHQQDDLIVVYQAYNAYIAKFAVEQQALGGSHFSYNRMSWIKPNFLWMMFRCGWASKENQERVLALWIRRQHFEDILNEAVFSSFDAKQYSDHDEWKKQLQEKEVRLQWDPDHDPYGRKQERRAIQLGLSGKILEEFGKRQVVQIEDITPFVIEQRKIVEEENLENLLVPVERPYEVSDETLKKKIALS